MKCQSKAYFLNSKKEWVPTIPTCPLWVHEKQVIVQISYCAICPFLAFYYSDGVECMHGDADWNTFLGNLKQNGIYIAGGNDVPVKGDTSWQQHPDIS